ncbi:MAG: hypothetical protein K0M45_07250 [Candidatus Paracaedibacteraceae bacterium]|nr:hypothetical protein [Candidatus Paracaedibacteraceae bacterium]
MNKFFPSAIKFSLLISCLSFSPQSYAMNDKENSSLSENNHLDSQQNIISATQSDTFPTKRAICPLHALSRLANNKIRNEEKNEGSNSESILKAAKELKKGLLRKDASAKQQFADFVQSKNLRKATIAAVVLEYFIEKDSPWAKEQFNQSARSDNKYENIVAARVLSSLMLKRKERGSLSFFCMVESDNTNEQYTAAKTLVLLIQNNDSAAAKEALVNLIGAEKDKNTAKIALEILLMKNNPWAISIIANLLRKTYSVPAASSLLKNLVFSNNVKKKGAIILLCKELLLLGDSEGIVKVINIISNIYKDGNQQQQQDIINLIKELFCLENAPDKLEMIAALSFNIDEIYKQSNKRNQEEILKMLEAIYHSNYALANVSILTVLRDSLEKIYKSKMSQGTNNLIRKLEKLNFQ